MQHAELPGAVDAPGGAGVDCAAAFGGAVEVAGSILRNAGQRESATKGGSGECVDNGDGASRRHAIHSAIAVGAALVGGAVEVSVRNLQQSGARVGSRGIDGNARGAECAQRGEGIERRERAGKGDAEDRAATAVSASQRRAVEVAISALDQRALGVLALAAVELMQQRERAVEGDAENRAGIAVAAAQCRSIQVAVIGLDQPAIGKEGFLLRIAETSGCAWPRPRG